MLEIIKHIWSGSWAVKACLIFLLLIYVLALISDPGRIIFTTLIMVAVVAVANRLFSYDDSDE